MPHAAVAIKPKTRELLDELARLEALNPLARYWLDPPGSGGMSPGQRRFHEDPARKRFLRCGNKVGKTYAVSAEVWAYLLGQHPYRNDVAQPCTVLYVVSDLEGSYADDVCKRLRELEPHGMLHPSCRYDQVRGYVVRGRRGILLRNGAQVIFRSGQQDGQALSGISADVVVINEPPRRSRWGEVMRAAAEHNAPILMAFTPIQHHGVKLLGDLAWLRKIVEAKDSTWSQTIIKLTRADCPHRTQRDIDEQIADIPPWERPQRINGDWEGAAVDRLFEGFDDRPVRDGGNVGDDADIPGTEVSVGLTFDHGEQPGNECALLYIYWRDPRSNAHRVVVLDEYVSQGRTTTDVDALRVLEMLQSHGLGLFHVDRAHGDVNSAGKTQLTSVNEALQESFAALARVASSQPPFLLHRPRKGPGSVLYGCRVLNMAFLRGSLIVHERCSTLIHALRNWQGTHSGADKDLTHTLDAARYGLVELLDTTSHDAQQIRVV